MSRKRRHPPRLRCLKRRHRPTSSGQQIYITGQSTAKGSESWFLLYENNTMTRTRTTEKTQRPNKSWCRPYILRSSFGSLECGTGTDQTEERWNVSQSKQNICRRTQNQHETHSLSLFTQMRLTGLRLQARDQKSCLYSLRCTSKLYTESCQTQTGTGPE